MKKILIAFLLLLVSPTYAWTDSDVLQAMTLGELAGAAEMMETSTKEAFSSGSIGYYTYLHLIEEFNEPIQAYNQFLFTHFNNSVYRSQRLDPIKA